MSPAGLAILTATVLALALRLFLVTRPGFLTSGTVEYDDGVYLGAALRLLHGALPYKDYAFVQPPGIIVVALPGALIGSLTSQATGLAAARILSVLASTACVPLAGRLVRHRGALACAVTAGLLAVYPADVLSGADAAARAVDEPGLPARGERGVPRGPPGEPAVARLGGRGVRLRRGDQVLGRGPRGGAAGGLPHRTAAGGDVTG